MNCAFKCLSANVFTNLKIVSPFLTLFQNFHEKITTGWTMDLHQIHITLDDIPMVRYPRQKSFHDYRSLKSLITDFNSPEQFRSGARVKQVKEQIIANEIK